LSYAPSTTYSDLRPDCTLNLPLSARPIGSLGGSALAAATSICRMAASTSVVEVILYRKKTSAVLCPEISIANFLLHAGAYQIAYRAALHSVETQAAVFVSGVVDPRNNRGIAGGIEGS